MVNTHIKTSWIYYEIDLQNYYSYKVFFHVENIVDELSYVYSYNPTENLIDFL